MGGVLYIEKAMVEATTGQMLLTLTSGGEDFRFHLPAPIALDFRHRIIEDTWQVRCIPDADVVPIRPTRGKGGKR